MHNVFVLSEYILVFWFMFGFLFVNCNTLQYLINLSFSIMRELGKMGVAFVTYLCHSQQQQKYGKKDNAKNYVAGDNVCTSGFLSSFVPPFCFR